MKPENKVNLRQQKGRMFEKDFSQEFHDRGIPLLLSSLVLRSRGAGQVDMARIERNHVLVMETKTHHPEVSRSQAQRLRRACEFVGVVLQMPVLLSLHSANT